MHTIIEVKRGSLMDMSTCYLNWYYVYTLTGQQRFSKYSIVAEFAITFSSYPSDRLYRAEEDGSSLVTSSPGTLHTVTPSLLSLTTPPLGPSGSHSTQQSSTNTGTWIVCVVSFIQSVLYQRFHWQICSLPISQKYC